MSSDGLRNARTRAAPTSYRGVRRPEMTRRDTATLAMASDPAKNRWFSRAWVSPPPFDRKSPDAPTPGAISKSRTNEIKDIAPLVKEQARALAERLFSSRGPA